MVEDLAVDPLHLFSASLLLLFPFCKEMGQKGDVSVMEIQQKRLWA